MNDKEALEKLKAYLKCQKRQVKGVHEDCNNKKCDNCDLCYMQGTTGEHIEAIESAIQSLESHKRVIERLKKELKLAEDVEERAVKENPLQFGRVKVCAVGIYNALEFVKTGGKEAITNYNVIKENSQYSLVSINIETGRKNQIRVAFKTLGNPIVGDSKYGIKDSYNRLYLHANRLKMYYPVIRKDILFETNNPVEFRKIMK